MEKNFEESIKELEEIVNKLESGEKPLEESMVMFEEGMKLSKNCHSILENIEKKIVSLVEEKGKIEEKGIE